MRVKSREDFVQEMSRLQQKHDNGTSSEIIGLLIPTLKHYEQFSSTFVRLMHNNVETSMMWGLLCLVIKVSLDHTSLS